MSGNILSQFGPAEDSRTAHSNVHQLGDVVRLTFCAVADGADGWEAGGDCETVPQAGHFSHLVHAVIEQPDQGHGLLEVRRGFLSGDLRTQPEPDRWSGWPWVRIVERAFANGEGFGVARRQLGLSIPADSPRFAPAFRGQWGGENCPR